MQPNYCSFLSHRLDYFIYLFYSGLLSIESKHWIVLKFLWSNKPLQIRLKMHRLNRNQWKPSSAIVLALKPFPYLIPIKTSFCIHFSSVNFVSGPNKFSSFFHLKFLGIENHVDVDRWLLHFHRKLNYTNELWYAFNIFRCCCIKFWI